MSKTLSDLPTDLHQLILSHDEEKIQLKKENEKLKTGVKMLKCLLDEARQDNDSDEEDDSENESEDEDLTLEDNLWLQTYWNKRNKRFEEEMWIEEEDLFQYTVKQLRSRLQNFKIKGFSNKNKALLVERLQLYGELKGFTHTHLFYW